MSRHSVLSKGVKGDQGDPGLASTVPGPAGPALSIHGTKAAVVNLPVSGAEGDAWIVDADNCLYIWDIATLGWDNVGQIQGADAVLPNTIPTATNLLWDDVRVSLLHAASGTNAPAFGTFRGTTQLLTFSKTTMQQVFFDIQLPHSWAVGTDVHAHLHWSTGGSQDIRPCRWGFEYSWANVGEAFPVSSTLYTDATGGGVAYGHEIDEWAAISGAGKKASSVLTCRLFRDAAHANDTFDAVAYALSLDLHIQIDKMGGLTEYAGT